MKKFEFRTTFSILLAITIVCLSFVFVRSNEDSDTKSIFSQNIQKVVELKVSFGGDLIYGTGAVIKDDGAIVTNKHMVRKSSTQEMADEIFVRFANESDYLEAEFVKFSESEDLALIKINRTNCEYFLFSKNWEPGETIYTIGNPNNFGLSITSGLVSAGLKIVLYEGQEKKLIQTSLVINEGNSGGPVFNRKGEIIGIISFRIKDSLGEVIQGVSFAVPSQIILSFINS